MEPTNDLGQDAALVAMRDIVKHRIGESPAPTLFVPDGVVVVAERPAIPNVRSAICPAHQASPLRYLIEQYRRSHCQYISF